MIHLHFGGQTYGPFALEQIKNMWGTGAVTYDTLYWNERTSAWEPIAGLLNQPGNSSRTTASRFTGIVATSLAFAVCLIALFGVHAYRSKPAANEPLPIPEASSSKPAGSPEQDPKSPETQLDESVATDTWYKDAQRAEERDPTSMIANASSLAKRYPESARAKRCLARAQLYKGYLPEARSSISDAIFLEPRNPIGWVTQALIYAESGRIDNAAKSFKEALSKGESEPAVWADAGSFYAKNGLSDSAFETLEKASTLLNMKAFDDHLGELHASAVWRTIATAYETLRVPDKAIDAYKALARTYESNGDVEAARGAYLRSDALVASKATSDPSHAKQTGIPGLLSATEIAAQAFPSVVSVKTAPNGDGGYIQGSGFLVAPNIVVTNLHVIKGATGGSVKFLRDSKAYRITRFVTDDPVNDIALLEIDSVDHKPLVLSRSEVEIGADIYAIGSPLGLEGTFTKGNVSGLRRFGESEKLQITAPISHGSSGGPILNTAGQVVGISVSTIQDGQNLNFAIPVKYLKTLLH